MTDIKNVTVLGAGVLGAQIAYQAAYAGFNVISYDINDDALAAAKERFDKLDGAYVRDVDDATEAMVKDARGRLSQSSDLKDSVSEADLVIEAVPEKLDLKKSIWSDVGEAAPESAIFTTNTSTLAPSDYRDATGRPEKFLALHFANKIRVNRTAEVMPTDATDPEIFKKVVEYAKDMGMVPVELKKEHPKYILNNLLVPFYDAALMLWSDGVAEPAVIDRDWRMSTGDPMGPFEIMDLVGLRTNVAVMSQSDDPKFRELSERIKKEYLDKGKLGKESGEGFLRYDDEDNRIDD